LMESTVLQLLDIEEGQALDLRTPLGSKTLNFVGTVHDPALAPAWQEQTAFGYITVDTLEYLMGSRLVDDLKVIFTGSPDEAQVRELTDRLVASTVLENSRIYEVMIPPPYTHPHMGQMKTILSLFILFAFLCVLLSAVLEANLVNSIMTREIKNIGIMKTLGGSPGRTSLIYLSSLALVSLIALIFAIPLGWLLGRTFAQFIGGMLNFTISSLNVSPWILWVVIASGLILPLSMSLFPITRALGISIKEALQPRGTKSAIKEDKQSRGIFPPLVNMVLRNSFRNKGRLLLSVLLLTVAGSLFFTARNTDAAWLRLLDEVFARQVYQLDVTFFGSADQEQIQEILGEIPLWDRAETWNLIKASPYRNSELLISKTYPDGGHGIFTVRGLDADTRLYIPSLSQGQWLSSQSVNGVVLNQRAYLEVGAPALGDSVSLVLGEGPQNFILQGVVEEILWATAYINQDYFQQILGQQGRVQSLILSLENKDSQAMVEFKSQLMGRLAEENIPVMMVMEKLDFQNAITEHIAIIIYSLIALSVIMAVVGLLGLGASMGSSVLERSRETGIMRAMGAPSGVIQALILLECLIIGLLGYLGGFILSLPLSHFLGDFLGLMAFQMPLSLTLSHGAALTWFVLIGLGSLASGIIPARRALNQSVKDTLLYE
ncbi:MAG: FtsX-like permease family protein, partial [Spirochaetaceae bacterium]|nr:FtsX-like permease family protein [Spirochaetaceae bacterium]